MNSGAKIGTGSAPGKQWGRIALQYLAAVAVVAVAVVLRWRLVDAFGPLPLFITFYPAVLLVASIGGGGPGIVATLLSALAADYWFLPPYGQFRIDAPNDILALGIFTGSNLFLSVLAERLRRARWAEAISFAQEQQVQELSRLNEELSQQSEELTQQAEELRRLYAEQQTIFNSVPAMIWYKDTQNNFVRVNQAVVQAVGKPREAIEGRSAYELFPDEAEHYYQDDREVIDSGRPKFGILEELGTASGEKRWVQTDKVPYRGAGDEITGVLLFSVDITERKRADEALARTAAEILRQKNLLAVTLASIGDGVIVTDAQGRVTFLNGEAEHLTGWTCGEAEGQSLPAVFHIVNEQTRQPVENPVEKVLRLGTVVELANHTLLLAKDGRETPIDDSGAPIRQSDDAVQGVVLVFRDCTEQKRVERSLARLAAIVESSDDAILSKDLHGVIQTWNAGAERLFGYRVEEIVGQSITRLLPPERIHEEEQILEHVRNGRRVEHLETVRLAKDGRRFAVSVSVSPVKDQDGQIIGISKSLRDITEHKQAEAALRETAEDLARSNKDLEQFAYVASHDLKEPLRMVTGFLSLLKDRCQGQLDAKADEYIAVASDAATRMHGLIDDLLAYSRAGRGELTERTDSGAVFDRVLRSLTIAIRESGAVITHDPLPTITSNDLELTQVFQNLIGNALKFKGPRNPAIHLGAQRQPGQWLFTVRDNGIGIDPQFANRIFMIFQRLHTREQYPGAGIGLAICKKIVERHGGRIWVESQIGQGSTFCFTIPDRGKGQG